MLTELFILPIKFYQWIISPWMGQNCRHQPICSQYTVEAIQEWGVVKGLFIGVTRLLKCLPWGAYNYDPIPKKVKR